MRFSLDCRNWLGQKLQQAGHHTTLQDPNSDWQAQRQASLPTWLS